MFAVYLMLSTSWPEQDSKTACSVSWSNVSALAERPLNFESDADLLRKEIGWLYDFVRSRYPEAEILILPKSLPHPSPMNSWEKFPFTWRDHAIYIWRVPYSDRQEWRSA